MDFSETAIGDPPCIELIQWRNNSFWLSWRYDMEWNMDELCINIGEVKMLMASMVVRRKSCSLYFKGFCSWYVNGCFECLCLNGIKSLNPISHSYMKYYEIVFSLFIFDHQNGNGIHQF